MTHKREVEVEREFPVVDENGDSVVDENGKEILENRMVTEERSFTALTVTAMEPMPVPEAPEPEPTAEERRDAQIFYTAMMTDTLLEEV